MRESRPRKRPARLGTGLLALLLLARAAGADPGIDDPAARVRTTVLDNGLTVLTLEDRTTPVVSFQIWVRVGSRDEARYTGLAHLFEHMMFKGSKHVGPEQHARLIQARGGEVNAYTSNDFTVYFDDVTPETLPLVIALEGERIANLDISEKTLDSERQVVLEERRLRTEDDPEGRAFEALMALAFTAHPYRTPVIGWRSDVEAATVEVCRRFFKYLLRAEQPVDRDRRRLRHRAGPGGDPPRFRRPRAGRSDPAQSDARARAARRAPADRPRRRAQPAARRRLARPGFRASGCRGARRRQPDPVGRALEPALPPPGLRGAEGAGGRGRLLGARRRRPLLRLRVGAPGREDRRRRAPVPGRDRAAARPAGEPRGAREGQAPARGLARERARHQPRARLADRARDRSASAACARSRSGSPRSRA